MSSDEYNASDEEYEYEYTDDEDVTMTTTHNDVEGEDDDSKPSAVDVASASEEKNKGSNKRRSSGSVRENPQGAPVGGIFDFGGEFSFLARVNRMKRVDAFCSAYFLLCFHQISFMRGDCLFYSQ